MWHVFYDCWAIFLLDQSIFFVYIIGDYYCPSVSWWLVAKESFKEIGRRGWEIWTCKMLYSTLALYIMHLYEALPETAGWSYQHLKSGLACSLPTVCESHSDLCHTRECKRTQPRCLLNERTLDQPGPPYRLLSYPSRGIQAGNRPWLGPTRKDQ